MVVVVRTGYHTRFCSDFAKRLGDDGAQAGKTEAAVPARPDADDWYNDDKAEEVID